METTTTSTIDKLYPMLSDDNAVVEPPLNPINDESDDNHQEAPKRAESRSDPDPNGSSRNAPRNLVTNVALTLVASLWILKLNTSPWSTPKSRCILTADLWSRLRQAAIMVRSEIILKLLEVISNDLARSESSGADCANILPTVLGYKRVVTKMDCSVTDYVWKAKTLLPQMKRKTGWIECRAVLGRISQKIAYLVIRSI